MDYIAIYVDFNPICTDTIFHSCEILSLCLFRVLEAILLDSFPLLFTHTLKALQTHRLPGECLRGADTPSPAYRQTQITGFHYPLAGSYT